ncbi:MAG: DUF4276 family protein [Nitrosomonas sp.]|uniref:DUF4276 family protein n=1 Tax=Nitrosomonas sp. TaxID=42353 RepID=UPI0027334970|nr:DUF4276 family protein [Nitrosomonas sp.]MDP3281011.1 DUF4276 family protein [Nitrosomonas sp.]MDP3664040.1 DUF4276 family protein [Nitrosomonas sp.]MDZ4104989.1 DUF4276 family protein [Nitrosomonas sp.]
MTWLRLYITVEGQTERKFADNVLRPYLASFSVEVKTRVVLTNRKLGKRGGILDFEKIRNDLQRLMHEDYKSEARFTTMIDLYALPLEFPGWAEAQKKKLPTERVEILESALQKEMGDQRFLPYIQLHEFETLLYCDLVQLQQRISGTEAAFAKLSKEVEHLEPEEINEGRTTAPSKRIITHVPIYDRLKVRVGASAAAAIGLPILRFKCPHFDNWILRLEQLK